MSLFKLILISGKITQFLVLNKGKKKEIPFLVGADARQG